MIRKDKASTDRASIRQYFQNAGLSGRAKAVMEACYGWERFYDEASKLADELIMAHPLKTRLIAEARIKTDTIDSEILARLLRANLIPEAYAPDSETRDKKNLLRYRSSLAAMKVRIKNIIHSVLTRNHIEEHGFTSLSDKFGKQGMAYLRAVTLKDNDTDILNDYLDLWEETEKRLKKQRNGLCALLQSIPGIGPILAVTIRYEIDDIERFMSAGKLCSSAGLVPSTYSSGNRTYQGKIAARE